MRKNPVLLWWNRFSKRLPKVPLFSHPKFLRIALLLIIAASIPLTVLVEQQAQEIRQHASGNIVCSSQTVTKVMACTQDGKTCTQTWYANTSTNCQLVPASDTLDCSHEDDEWSAKADCANPDNHVGNYCNTDTFYIKYQNLNDLSTQCYYHYKLNKNNEKCVLQKFDDHCDTQPTASPVPGVACRNAGGTCMSSDDCMSPNTIDTSKSCGPSNQNVGVCCIAPTTKPGGGTVFKCEGKSNPNEKNTTYACQKSGCESGWTLSAQNPPKHNNTCSSGQVCCYKDDVAATATPNPNGSGSGNSPTATPRPNGGGNPTATPRPNGSGNNPTATPKPNGSGKNEPTPTPKNNFKGVKPAPGCKPGEMLHEYNDIPCPKGLSGTCGGHSYCEWHEDGNQETAPICETEKDTCYDPKKSGSNNNSNNACKDNPVAPPDGYIWKQDCSSSCNNNDDCPANTSDPAVQSDTSHWCYAGKCLKLVSGSSSSKNSNANSNKNSNSNNKNKNNSNKKSSSSSKKSNSNSNSKNSKNNNKNSNSNNKNNNNNNKNNGNNPTATPTPTPGPNTPTVTPTPTPLPPLAEPSNWQGFCGPTTNKDKPLGIKVSWDAVSGATRYAVRIDEDAPSWEGDTPSPGDTVDNNVKEIAYVREAKAGATYQWWVHSVNASGVYSALSKKLIIKCPTSANGTVASSSAGTVGAGQLIVLP